MYTYAYPIHVAFWRERSIAEVWRSDTSTINRQDTEFLSRDTRFLVIRD